MGGTASHEERLLQDQSMHVQLFETKKTLCESTSLAVICCAPIKPRSFLYGSSCHHVYLVRAIWFPSSVLLDHSKAVLLALDKSSASGGFGLWFCLTCCNQLKSLCIVVRTV